MSNSHLNSPVHAKESGRRRIWSDIRGLGKETWAICVSAFLADIVLGSMSATFSIHAHVSGLDPVSIGTLAAAGGFVSLGVTIPVGVLSDRVGRKRVIGAGHTFFALSMALLAFAGSFWTLMAGRILFALGSVSVFQTGTARLGDITPPRLRHTAFGLLSTCMGLGFGTGPLLGGLLTDLLGHLPTYLIISAVGIGALTIVFRSIGGGTPRARSHPGVLRGLQQGFSEILRSPDILLVTLANMMAGVTFTGTIGTFLPLYGRELAISQTSIGVMFAVRSWVSALGRIPASVAVRHLGNHVYLLLGLFAEATCMFLLWIARSQATILVVLACEGLAYAGFMVAGQTYLAARTTEANRGTVGGIYAMASGLASTVSPFALGVVAERWSLRTVFVASGAILGMGFLLFAAGFLALRSRLREEHEGDEESLETAQSVSPLTVRSEKLVSNRDGAGA
jgi:MFS family permease